MDDLIFEEFKGRGHSEIVLDRKMSDKRIYAAIDINRSGTRKEDVLIPREELNRVWILRKVLNPLSLVETKDESQPRVPGVDAVGLAARVLSFCA